MFYKRYLEHRLKTLEPLINELIPHKPQLSELQVIGNKLFEKKSNEEHQAITDLNEIYVDNTWVNPNIIRNSSANDNPYYMETGNDDFLAQYPDVATEPVFGPAILFGGQAANWTGRECENTGIVALESRLNFETKAGKRVLATFEIHNIGTTTIYFDWKVGELN